MATFQTYARGSKGKKARRNKAKSKLALTKPKRRKFLKNRGS
jgi:hypothetical protein